MSNYIHHIRLTVSNLKKSLDFYKKVLGWKIVHQDKNFVALAPDTKAAKDFILGLATYRDHKIPKNKFDRNRIGLDHLVFLLKTLMA